MARRKVAIAVAALLAAALLVVADQPAAVAEDQPLVITAAGDFGAGSNSAAVFDAIHASGSALTLAVGDMSYGTTGQEQAWCDFVTSRLGAGYPMELVSGNHESNGLNGNINDFSACLPNQLPGAIGTYGRQWYVDVPAAAPVARFIMISPSLAFPDETYSYAAGTPHYTWTAAAIDGARSRSIPWVVVGMHKPCLSIGEYQCDPGADLVNMLIQKKVDLVLTGHEHLYERTKQLALSSACPTLTIGTYQAACVADADNDLAKDAGTVFATVGTGGVVMRDVHPEDAEAPYFVASEGNNTDPTWGVLRLALTPNALSAGFVRAAGGAFTDAFTVTRGSPPANAPPRAAFAAPACTGQTCQFDASAAADSDGTITGYAWDFGDGATGTGVTVSHAYAAPGTYTATLTVTDNGGATGSTGRTFPVSASSFSETFPGADGSPWPSGWVTGTANGSATQTGGAGVLGFSDVANGYAKAQLVAPAARADAQLLTSYRFASTTSLAYVNVWLRGSTWNGSYRPRDGYGIQLSSSSSSISVAKTVNGAMTTLAGVANAQTVTTAKQWLRLQVVGSTIQFRTWVDGQPEPTSWRSTVTDTAVTAPGQLFLSINRAASNTGVKSVALDDLSYGPPQ